MFENFNESFGLLKIAEIMKFYIQPFNGTLVLIISWNCTLKTTPTIDGFYLLVYTSIYLKKKHCSAKI